MNVAKKHKYIIGISVIFIIILILEEVTLFKDNIISPIYIYVFILELLSLVILMLYPALGCCLVIGSWFLGAYVTPVLPSTFFFAFIFSIILISYLNFHIAIPLIGLLISGCIIYNNSIYQFKDLIPLIGLYVTCFAIGFSLKMQKNTYKRKKQIEQFILNKKYAAELHDNICNELSYLYISLSEDSSFLRIPSSNQYLETISITLDQTRSVIYALENPNSMSNRARHSSISVEIKQMQTTLEKYGYRLITFIHSPEFITHDNTSIIIHILQEITSNVVKYADIGTPIYFSISASMTRVTVSITNARRSTTFAQQNHTGLKRIKEEIDEKHGTMEITQSESSWSALITLPQ